MTTPTLTPTGPLSPYVTPQLLTQAPTGISWSSIPAGGTRSGVTAESRLAEQSNICARATALVDGFCKQPLRATVDTVTLYAPGRRAGVNRNRSMPSTLIMTRWPVLAVTQIQVAQNSFPRNFTTVPPGQYEPRYPVVGLYGSVAPAAAGEGGQAITLAPGWLNWNNGKEAYIVDVSYINGWPHTSLTADAAASESEIQVDDCTGWAITSAVGNVIGATGTMYDAKNQEILHVTGASAAAGPGTLTLAAPLLHDHQSGVMVSTLPQSAVWAATLFAVDIALERGATSTTIQETPGKQVAEGAGVSTKNSGTPSDWAEAILCGTFNRII